MRFGAASRKPSGRRLLTAALVLVLALAAALVVQEELRPWRRWQRRAVAVGVLAQSAAGVIEVEGASGAIERCVTCHVAALTDAPRSELAPPLQAHPALDPAHDPARLGCTVCHGGSGLALDPAVAHSDPETGARDPRLVSPWRESRCVACHLPGAVRGTERLVRGASIYLGLGCGICHGAGGSGDGAQEGPSLVDAPAQRLETLRRRIADPRGLDPTSTMPAFGRSFASQPVALDDLLLFVRSLREPRLVVTTRLASSTDPVSCAACHDGATARGAAHHCVYLRERSDELACRHCHTSITTSTRPCPVITAHWKACAACHRDASGRAP